MEEKEKLNNAARRAAFGADMERVHPDWTKIDIQYAWQMIPTDSTYLHPPGTVAHVAERERHEKAMKTFISYVMNPDAPALSGGAHWEGTDIVDKPRATGSMVPRAKRNGHAAPNTADDGVDRPRPQPVGKMVKAGSKKAAVAEMIKRPNGTTVDDICNELGIGAVAARGLLSDCRKAGVTMARQGDRYVSA